MRFTISILTLGAALAASPALAQIQVGGQAGVNVGAGANVDGGGLLGGVTNALGRTVNAVDGTVNGLANAGLRLATRADLRAGAEVRDNRGRRIGTIAEVHGDTAVVVRSGKAVHVPLSALYRSGNGLVTSLSRTELRAAASANANANAGARY